MFSHPIFPEQSEIQSQLSNLEELVAQLYYEVNNFPLDLVNTPLFDKWSLKDILAHFSGWNILTVYNIDAALTEEYSRIIWIDDEEIEVFNKMSVDERKAADFQDVYNEFRQSSQRLLEKYRSLNTEQLNIPLQPNNIENKFPIWQSIQVDIEHFQLHLNEIMEKVQELNSEQ